MDHLKTVLGKWKQEVTEYFAILTMMCCLLIARVINGICLQKLGAFPDLMNYGALWFASIFYCSCLDLTFSSTTMNTFM